MRDEVHPGQVSESVLNNSVVFHLQNFSMEKDKADQFHPKKMSKVDTTGGLVKSYK